MATAIGDSRIPKAERSTAPAYRRSISQAFETKSMARRTARGLDCVGGSQDESLRIEKNVHSPVATTIAQPSPSTHYLITIEQKMTE